MTGPGYPMGFFRNYISKFDFMHILNKGFLFIIQINHKRSIDLALVSRKNNTESNPGNYKPMAPIFKKSVPSSTISINPENQSTSSIVFHPPKDYTLVPDLIHTKEHELASRIVDIDGNFIFKNYSIKISFG